MNCESTTCGSAVPLWQLALTACGSNGDGVAEQAATATLPIRVARCHGAVRSFRIAVAWLESSTEIREVAASTGSIPRSLRFEVGQEVTFSLSGETEFHTFTVDELDIDVSMDVGETVEYTYTFDEAGTFRLYCIPHEALGMTGEIVVE